MDKANLAEAVNGHIDNKVITPKVLRQWGDKVGAVSVVGKASKNLFNVYKYGENNTYTGNVSKYNIINNNEIEISYINGWSRLVLKVTGLEPNTDYTISAYLDKSNYDTSVASGFYDGSEYKDSGFTKGSGNVYLTFTSSSTGTFDMWFYGNWSGTNYSGSVIYKNIQLEKGSATEYEKYFEPMISVKDSNGDYHEVPYVTGKVSKNLYPSGLTQVFSAPLIKLTKGTYTITEIDTTSGNWYFGAYKNGSVLSSGVSFSVAFNWSSTTEVWYRVDETLKGFTFTLNEDCEVQIGRLNATGTQKVQLEKGSTATEYEEYYEPTISIINSNGIFQEVEINKNNYSTAEQVIGTWIDGKPLYRKMVDFGSLPSNAALDIAHNIANVEHMHVNIGETLWCLNSQSYTGQGQIFSPVFTNYISSIYADNTYISVKTIAPDANAFKMLMCLEYTKN